MNRLSSPARPAEIESSLDASLSSDAARLMIQPVLTKGTPTRSPHFSLFIPQHYEKNYAYPLVVWLHGPRDDERQLHRVMPKLSLRNYVGVGPRGVCLHGDDTPGFHWGSSDSAVLAAEAQVFDAIESARLRTNIAPDRIFLAGFECGGTMAMRLGMRHPERFAGIISIGGPFPSGRQPLLSLHQARRLPLFIGFGRDSETYTADLICEELRLYHAAAMRVSLFQYPCGDELTTKILSDMNAWIMERVTGQPMQQDQPYLPPVEAN